jgi:hypothetical protein
MVTPNAKLSCQEALPIIGGWKHLARIEQGGTSLDGKITGSSPALGTLEFPARKVSDADSERERLSPVKFALPDADFQRIEPGEEFEEAFVAFPFGRKDSVVFRKWKVTA